ncbi:hypothetical protein [Erythrobacter crassostreae]|uniref:Uncharacterized protein n=1 Tax=Erythrobacter crassostreae TaxID=2828328 RepID=A0A9X1F4D3_9SPHN|nr:hypothetical protein [Erythrobacter crassostrea]MBV7260025.1 hypothetical protein [Erythrobacter crassostrea]
MSEMAWISLVSLIGWLVIAGSAVASYQLGWSKLVRMVLVWVAIFCGAFVIASFFVGE